MKRSLNSTAPVTARTDFNRDGRVNALDLAAVKARLNQTLILPRPAASAAAPAAMVYVPPAPPPTAERRDERVAAELLA